MTFTNTLIGIAGGLFSGLLKNYYYKRESRPEATPTSAINFFQVVGVASGRD
jgi:hypothetical protein